VEKHVGFNGFIWEFLVSCMEEMWIKGDMRTIEEK
jgi:hypothetical protein